MKERVRPFITVSEAHCRCGCGLTPGGKALDWMDDFISLCGFSIPISTTARCKKYNDKIGGVLDSPHLIKPKSEEDEGAADYRCRNPKRRMVLLEAAIHLKQEGTINHIEVCDRHIHVGKVPVGHRLAGLLNWGRSK